MVGGSKFFMVATRRQDYANDLAGISEFNWLNRDVARLIAGRSGNGGEKRLHLFRLPWGLGLFMELSQGERLICIICSANEFFQQTFRVNKGVSAGSFTTLSKQNGVGSGGGSGGG